MTVPKAPSYDMADTDTTNTASPPQSAPESGPLTTTGTAGVPGNTTTTTAAPPDASAEAAPAEVKGDDEVQIAPAAKPKTDATADTPASPEGADEVTYDLQAPEGSTLDDAAIAAVSEFAKSHGLSQEQAQAVLERDHAAAATAHEGAHEAYAEKVKEWAAASLADPDLGGEKLAETQRFVGAGLRVAEEVAPGFRGAFDELGLLNHPVALKFMRWVGSERSEGGVLPGGGQPSEPKDEVRAFYNNSPDLWDK